MTPMAGPRGTRTDRADRGSQAAKTMTDLRKPYCGRFLAITIRCTWLVPS